MDTSNIQLAIEGPGAVEATTELLASDNFEGSWQPPEGTHRAVTLATIATIVGIVGGTLSAADQLVKWYKDWKGKEGKQLKKVVLVGKNGKRVILENATAEEIKAVLED